MFESIFYPTLVLTSVLSLYLLKTRKATRPKRWYLRLLKGKAIVLLFLMATTLWAFQVVQIAAPKGTKWHEATRLPKHMLNLSRAEVTDIELVKVPYGDHDRQYVMLCNSKKVKPYQKETILYLHGGGWHVGSPHQHLALAKILAEQGYRVIMGAYRLGPVHKYEDLRQDISTALVKTLDILEEQGETNPEIILGGTSAGANLAALLMYDREELDKIGLDQSLFKGFFAMAGALDIGAMPQTRVLHSYAGTPTSHTFCQANPVNHFSSCEDIPVFCMHGDKDGLVKYNAAESFVSKLQKVQCSNVEFHTIKEGTHLNVASSWYYNPNDNHGQAEKLLSWLDKL
ncbi:MAG: alpha/beta hydrolase [Aureispira sp.]|nr:alpha/beta hydrolase [Aureispira sp.]